MKWVQEQATFPFELPNLPHLSEKDKEAYKTQVREREEALEAKRRQEQRDMMAEERARAEIQRKKRKLAKMEAEKKDHGGSAEAEEDHEEF